jgi:hypothetical protein
MGSLVVAWQRTAVWEYRPHLAGPLIYQLASSGIVTHPAALVGSAQQSLSVMSNRHLAAHIDAHAAGPFPQLLNMVSVGARRIDARAE